MTVLLVSLLGACQRFDLGLAFLPLATPEFDSSTQPGGYVEPASVLSQVVVTSPPGALGLRYTLESKPVETLADSTTWLDYTGPIQLEQGTTTITVYAYNAQTNISGFLRGTFIREVAPVTSSLAAGTYNYRAAVALSCLTEGAELRYTTDGSEPTETSALYTTPLVQDDGLVLKARAFLAGRNPSGAFSAEYVWQTDPVSVSLDSGVYGESREIDFSSTSPDSVFWYTAGQSASDPVVGTGLSSDGKAVPDLLPYGFELRVLAKAPGCLPSAIVSRRYHWPDVIHVAADGSDTHSGSSSEPLAHISTALDRIEAWRELGAIKLRVAQGSYTESSGIAIARPTELSGGWNAAFTAVSGLSALTVASPLSGGSENAPAAVLSFGAETDGSVLSHFRLQVPAGSGSATALLLAAEGRVNLQSCELSAASGNTGQFALCVEDGTPSLQSLTLSGTNSAGGTMYGLRVRGDARPGFSDLVIELSGSDGIVCGVRAEGSSVSGLGNARLDLASASGALYGIWTSSGAVVNLETSDITMSHTGSADLVALRSDNWSRTSTSDGSFDLSAGAGGAYGLQASSSARSLLDDCTLQMASSGSGDLYGVYADGSRPVVRDTSIELGGTSGSLYGLYAANVATEGLVIEDSLIAGGSTTGSSCAVYLRDVVTARVRRNRLYAGSGASGARALVVESATVDIPSGSPALVVAFNILMGTASMGDNRTVSHVVSAGRSSSPLFIGNTIYGLTTLSGTLFYNSAGAGATAAPVLANNNLTGANSAFVGVGSPGGVDRPAVFYNNNLDALNLYKLGIDASSRTLAQIDDVLDNHQDSVGKAVTNTTFVGGSLPSNLAGLAAFNWRLAAGADPALKTGGYNASAYAGITAADLYDLYGTALPAAPATWPIGAALAE